jgi:small-conductance mechanosensitive channel
MDPLSANPFAVLTLIGAPAILTNASAVMSLSTSNRFARAVDRARALAKEFQTKKDTPDDHAASRFRQLTYANRRALLLVRALTAFYVSLGAFAAAALTSLFGAVFFAVGVTGAREVTMFLAILCGLVGVGGLVGGSFILVWETRLTLAIVREETEIIAMELKVGMPTGKAAEPKGGAV